MILNLYISMEVELFSPRDKEEKTLQFVYGILIQENLNSRLIKELIQELLNFYVFLKMVNSFSQ